jgi:hypothetical protein
VEAGEVERKEKTKNRKAKEEEEKAAEAQEKQRWLEEKKDKKTNSETREKRGGIASEKPES